MLPPRPRAVALVLLLLLVFPPVLAQDVPEPDGPPSPIGECPEGYPFNPPECRPDLIVIGASHTSTDVRFSPNSRLCASFVNIGRTTVAAPFRLTVHVDGNLAGETIVQVKQQEEVPAPDPDDPSGTAPEQPPPANPTDVPGYQTGQGDGPYCFGVTLTPGTHPYFFRVDANGEIDETNETNNQMKTAYVKVGDYPTVDLAITGLGVSPRDPRPSDNQLLIARVRNTGQTPTGNQTVVFEDDNGVIGTTRVPPLYPRQVTDVVVLTRPELRTPGNFTLTATLDPENDLKEINESNNAMSTPYFVAEHPAPDLYIQNVTYYGNFTARRGIHINVTYANQGDRGILAPSIRVYDDNVSLGNHTARVLNVQQKAGGQFRLVLGAGYHQLRIVTDPDNKIGERNEKNNVYYLNLTIFPGLTEFPTPNLVVERVTVAPDDPRPGEPVRISALVTNIGDLGSNKTDAEFRVNGRSIGNVTVPAIPAEASVVVSLPWDGGTEGVYDFVVTGDPRNKIAEIDEGDNELGLSFVIQTTAPPPPPPAQSETKDEPITPPTEEPPINEDIIEAPQEPRLLPGNLAIGFKPVPGGLRAIALVGLRNPTLESVPSAFVTFKVDGQVVKEVLVANVRPAAITNATTGEIDIPSGRHNMTAEIRVAGSTQVERVSRIYEQEAGPEEKTPMPAGLLLAAAVLVALLRRPGGRR